MANESISLLNMLICDGAHREPGSGKWTLLGLFNSINAGAFPTSHPQMIAYLALRGAEGKIPLRLQMVAADRKDEPLFKIEAELTVGDPRLVADLVIPVRGVTFTKAGEYLLQVYANNQFVGERAITAVLTRAPGGPGGRALGGALILCPSSLIKKEARQTLPRFFAL